MLVRPARRISGGALLATEGVADTDAAAVVPLVDAWVGVEVPAGVPAAAPEAGNAGLAAKAGAGGTVAVAAGAAVVVATAILGAGASMALPGTAGRLPPVFAPVRSLDAMVVVAAAAIGAWVGAVTATEVPTASTPFPVEATAAGNAATAVGIEWALLMTPPPRSVTGPQEGLRAAPPRQALANSVPLHPPLPPSVMRVPLPLPAQVDR